MKRTGFLSLILPLLLIWAAGPANAAVSKTSKRVIRLVSNPALTVVPGFTSDTLSKTRIQWSWSTGSFTGSGIDGYKLHSSSTANVIPLSINTSFYIDSALSSNHSYTRWITSYQGTEQSSDSEHLEKYTFASPPATFELSQVTSTSAYITWQYSNATAYAVEYSTDGGVYYARNRAIFVPWQTLQLMSNRNYRLRIGALNGENEITPGEYSVVKTTTTPPLDVQLHAVTHSSYTIEWQWDIAPFTDTAITAFNLYKSSFTEAGAPVATDTGTIIATLSPSTSYWIETFSNGSNLTGDTQHVRWLKAAGILESPTRLLKNKYTYAVAPSSCGLLSTPTDFLNIGENFVNLEWSSGRLATKYVVHMSTSADFDVSLTTFAAEGARTYSVTGLTANAKHDFRIAVINGDGELTPANALNPEAYSPVYKVLARLPTTPTTCNPLTDTIINLSWSTATYTGMPHVTGYVVSTPVYHQELSMWVNHPISPLIADLTTHEYPQDYRLTNSTHSMGIAVKQFAAGYAAYGSYVINDICATFATPPNDVSFDTTTARTVSMWWRHPEVPATEYRIERSTTLGERGPWVFVSSAAGTRYTDSGLAPSTTYSYRIGAINLLGQQTVGLPAATDGYRRDYSFVSSTMTRHSAPVMYGVAYGTAAISWSWANDVPGVLSFAIYSSTYGQLVSGLSAATTFWLETNLSSANITYTRNIASLRSDGIGEYGEASAVTFASPPTALAATATGHHNISLAWSGNGGTRYSLSRSPDLVTWTPLKTWSDALASAAATDTGLQLDTTYYYAVSAYNSEGRVSLSSATSAAIRTLGMPAGVTAVYSTATLAQTITAPLPGVGQVAVSLPAGAITANGYIRVSTSAAAVPVDISKASLDAATLAFAPNSVITGSVIELHYYSLLGAAVTGNFASPARVTITYTDANGDGVLDGITPQASVDTLKLLSLDTTAGEWVPLRSSFTDKAGKTVYSDVSHFSFYALGSVISAAGELQDTFAYPNPYKPGSSGSFGNTSFGEGIVFESLPARSTIKIFNVAGGLVKEISDDDGDGRCLWNGRNSNGTTAASGIYLYLVNSPAGGKKTGRISIIR